MGYIVKSKPLDATGTNPISTKKSLGMHLNHRALACMPKISVCSIALQKEEKERKKDVSSWIPLLTHT